MFSHHLKATCAKLAAATLPLLLAGCISASEEATVVAKPKSLPVRTLTNFSESLVCMDELLADFGRSNIVITSDGIPDATASVFAGTKDMLISTISRMSISSGAFTFVDFDQRELDVHSLQSLIGFTDDFVVPNYYIRGAITQLDEGVLAESESLGIGIRELSVGGARDQVVSVLALDLNVGNLVTRQIIPGISAHNSIAVARRGLGSDLAATIDKLGVAFNVTLDRAEGVHQAVRTLIELSTIEVLGKLAQVPYWRCLQIEQTNPAVVEEARGWFRAMSETEQVVFTQRALAAQGYYGGPITGQRDEGTKAAIAQYQAEHDLIADGRVNFDLYASLINQDLAIGRAPDPSFAGQFVEASLKTSAAPRPGGAPLRPNPLTVSLATPLGNAPIYEVEQLLTMTATTSRDAYLYCYYADARNTVVRIYPNVAYPDPRVGGGQATAVPGAAAGFDIVFDRAGAREEVACIASAMDMSTRLPQGLRVDALQPLAVGSLDDVIETFERLDAANTSAARLPIQVAPVDS